MPVDIRQIGGDISTIPGNTAFIDVLDARYGGGNSSTGSSATVLPTFTSDPNISFGSPGVSITPAATGSSTYNVKLGLPASLEAVTSGGNSSAVPTLSFENGGYETVASGGGIQISLKSGQTTQYYTKLQIPNSVITGGGSAVSVGTTLNKGSVTFSSIDSSWGVFPTLTSSDSNTYNLNLVLPNGATVTSSGGNGGGGGSNNNDLLFSTLPPDYTAMSTAARVEIQRNNDGLYDTKLYLPATASQSSGNGDVLPSNVLTFNSPMSVETTGSANIAIAHSAGDTYNIYATIPTATNTTTTTSTGSCIQFVDAGIISTASTLNSKLTAGNGLYALKMTFHASGSNALCYGYWTKIEDNGIGILIAENTETHLLDFRIAYILNGQFGGTSLFQVNQKDGNFQSLPWAHLGTMSLDKFRSGLQGSNAPEGLIPIDVTIANTTYYTMLMKRSGAYGGLGINSKSKPFYMAFNSSNYFVADRLVTFNELTTNIAGAIVDCISNIINTWAASAVRGPDATHATYWLSGINTSASGYKQYRDSFVSQLSQVFNNTY